MPTFPCLTKLPSPAISPRALQLSVGLTAGLALNLLISRCSTSWATWKIYFVLDAVGNPALHLLFGERGLQEVADPGYDSPQVFLHVLIEDEEHVGLVLQGPGLLHVREEGAVHHLVLVAGEKVGAGAGAGAGEREREREQERE